MQIDGPTSFHGGLVVQDGVIYTGTARETVALDATNCALKWKFVYQPEEARCGGSSRGVALLERAASSGAHVMAGWWRWMRPPASCSGRA